MTDFDKAPTRLISIHALREEGDGISMLLSLPIKISIHALREEGDASPVQPRRMVGNFYPRPPRGGRHAGSRKPCRDG